MGTILFSLFVGVPIIEIGLFIEVGGRIGVWPTIGVVILTALVGTALLRRQGLATLKKAQTSMDQGQFPIDVVFDGLCLVIAGALLLTPGFFTDAVGLLLFVPPFRMFLRTTLARVLAERGHIKVHTSGFQANPGDVIDGEFEDITPGDTPPPEHPRLDKD